MLFRTPRIRRKRRSEIRNLKFNHKHMKSITLKSGNEIPSLGFGTWKLKGDDAKNAVAYALKIGYRHIDAAEIYDNQIYIGAAILESQIPREDIFITSKVFHDHLEPEQIVESCVNTLKDLQTNYLDLLLLHWPNKDIAIEDQLGALNSLKEKNLVKSIGVSNYNIRHLTEALDAEIEFDVNQVEFHPSLNQIKLKQFCEENGIVITAYSPIAQGQDLVLPTVLEVAKKYKKTPSQTILNWIISQDMVTIPRSNKEDHIKDNFGALGWEMEKSDIERLNKLNTNNRLINREWGEFD